MLHWEFKAIGIVHTACKEKFGLPRQSGLVPGLTAQIEILPPYNRKEAFVELSGFSHIWVLGLFHEALAETWQMTVRPPRLGGNRRVGVFASRSPFRPNPVSLSVMRLRQIRYEKESIFLLTEGNDLVDGTPVLDIKPYVSYADAIPNTTDGYAGLIDHKKISVEISQSARSICRELEAANYTGLEELIKSLIAQDPRPAYQLDSAREYGMHLYDLNIRFFISDNRAIVTGIERLGE